YSAVGFHPDLSDTMERTDPIGSLIDRLCHTREQLADQLGVSPAALYSWSVGRRTPRPGNRTELVRIARMHARELAALAADLDRGGAVRDVMHEAMHDIAERPLESESTITSAG